ncbi:hypothetical protein [Otariodibacter oris]|uniref:Uncharacterized protein n=1 Tax=Otariodibacter oris TaxID=1032623 RepID=A0A420XJM3_9PAST|nr:hypothetical protein [Otariodibacter oris]QGM80501.1 hypothetical protein A6A10_03350 [Otariodibacter oris]RKR77348.1 hypothetical protein DES31_0678 [Otariodibacter oris]
MKKAVLMSLCLIGLLGCESTDYYNDERSARFIYGDAEFERLVKEGKLQKMETQTIKFENHKVLENK